MLFPRLMKRFIIGTYTGCAHVCKNLQAISAASPHFVQDLTLSDVKPVWSCRVSAF